MKRFLTMVGCLALTSSLFAAVYATSGQVSATLDYADIKITLDGQEIVPVNAQGEPVEPFAINGTTYLPVRAISNALGLEVSWDAATSTVVLTHPDQAAPVQPTAAPSSTDDLTMGQHNALKKAESYLRFSSFSRKGLIEQLVYSEFSEEDATYAADHCGADWNEQAAKKAASYLSHSAFSRNGLIEQLEYEGFTHEQAVYGVTANGY